MKSNLKDIFDQNYAGLCNYANVIVQNKHTAEDIVQSVFIQLWENDKIFELENPSIYLLKCVKYKCLDYLKSPKRKMEVYTDTLPDIHHDQQEQLSENEILPLLHFFTKQLPSKMQQVFLMSRQQGMSYREIAEELNISVKTVENQMGTALKKLRKLLHAHHYLPIILMSFN